MVVGAGFTSDVVIHNAVIQGTRKRSATRVCRIASKRAVVQRAVVSSAAEGVTRVAHQHAVVEYAARRAATVKSLVGAQRAVLQHAAIGPATEGVSRVAAQHTVGHHRIGRFAPQTTATVRSPVR